MGNRQAAAGLWELGFPRRQATLTGVTADPERRDFKKRLTEI